MAVLKSSNGRKYVKFSLGDRWAALRYDDGTMTLMGPGVSVYLSLDQVSDLRSAIQRGEADLWRDAED